MRNPNIPHPPTREDEDSFRTLAKGGAKPDHSESDSTARPARETFRSSEDGPPLNAANTTPVLLVAPTPPS